MPCSSSPSPRSTARPALALSLALGLGLAAVACSRADASDGPAGAVSAAETAAASPPEAPAPTSAARSAPAFGVGPTVCGDPEATPKQVVNAYLSASQAGHVDGMLACMQPKHRDSMRKRPLILQATPALHFTLGAERVQGDEAEVDAKVERRKVRGGTEEKDGPIRLRRVDGAWYFR